MILFLGRRFAAAILTLLGIMTLTFILLHALPGGPFDSENALPPEIQAQIEARYRLDQPVWRQYLIYMKHVAQGDFGESYKYLGQKISDMIKETLPVSLLLGFYSLIFSYLLGIPMGVFAAANHQRWKDYVILLVTNAGVSLPSFLTAPLLILVFSFWLDWFPPALWEGPSYYILPVVALAIRPTCLIARLIRSSVLETINTEFVRTARAKGLTEERVLFKHVLKSSLVPLMGISGSLITYILSGSFVIEQIFAIPGIARHFVEGTNNRDYPLIMGLTVVYTALLIGANIVVDLCYSFVDPRIKTV